MKHYWSYTDSSNTFSYTASGITTVFMLPVWLPSGAQASWKRGIWAKG